MNPFDRAWDLVKSNDDVKSLIKLCNDLLPLISEREAESLDSLLQFLNFYNHNPSQYDMMTDKGQLPPITAIQSEVNLLLSTISEKPDSPLSMPLMDDSGWMPFGEDLA
tara:strand:- start:705 stop:1031 length:327 start_codon:yes stop_codon:yes gene_type:complete